MGRIQNAHADCSQTESDTMTEQETTDLENQFPLLAVKAFSQARQRALAAGLSLVESDKGYLYKVFPNGKRKRLRKLKDPN
jgi:hypothetical protein